MPTLCCAFETLLVLSTTHALSTLSALCLLCFRLFRLLFDSPFYLRTLPLSSYHFLPFVLPLDSQYHRNLQPFARFDLFDCPAVATPSLIRTPV